MLKTKYEEWLKEENLNLLIEWGKKGLTNSQIAKNIGISERTFYKWLEKYKEINDSLKKGKEIADKEIENALYKRALGYEFQEEKVYIEEVKGVVKKRKEIIKRHTPGNVTAQIFWLKNRNRETWNNRD